MLEKIFKAIADYLNKNYTIDQLQEFADSFEQVQANMIKAGQTSKPTAVRLLQLMRYNQYEPDFNLHNLSAYPSEDSIVLAWEIHDKFMRDCAIEAYKEQLAKGINKYTYNDGNWYDLIWAKNRENNAKIWPIRQAWYRMYDRFRIPAYKKEMPQSIEEYILSELNDLNFYFMAGAFVHRSENINPMMKEAFFEIVDLPDLFFKEDKGETSKQREQRIEAHRKLAFLYYKKLKALSLSWTENAYLTYIGYLFYNAGLWKAGIRTGVKLTDQLRKKVAAILNLRNN